MADKTYVSSMKLPTGSVVYFKDDYARELIADLTGSVGGVMHYVGTTTTALTDGATTSPIQVDAKAYTPAAGDVVSYNNREFAWSDTASKWFEFGSTGALKALAFKDTASGTVTPTGTVSKPSFTGTEGNVSVTGTPNGSVAMSTGTGAANYTPAGSVSQPSFTGTEGNVSVTGTPSGSVTISKGTGTANYTPQGSVSQPSFTGTEGNVSVSGTPSGNVTISKGTGTANYTPEGTVSVTPTVTASKTTVKPFGSAGTLPSLSFTVNGDSLDISWSQGTLPSAGADVSVATDIASASATATFTGTGAELKASFSGNSLNSTGKFTPSGSVSQPTFTGTGAELKATFSGNSTTSTGKFTPVGTVAKPTFTGTGVELKATFTGSSTTSTGKFTPAGSVSQPTFTGDEKTVTVS